MFGALVGLKTEEEPNEDDGPWLLEDTITLPSQYKYRKKRLPDWRKAHDFTHAKVSMPALFEWVFAVHRTLRPSGQCPKRVPSTH